MRRLTAILCLTLAVLLGSTITSYRVYGSDTVQSHFGDATLNLPYPDNLCLLGNSWSENVLRDHQKEAQERTGNKVLGIWIDCSSQKKFLRNLPDTRLNQWVIVVGTKTGKPRKEKTYPLTSQEKFLKVMLKEYGNLPLDDIRKKANENLKIANSKILGDRDAILATDQISLGVLAVTDSIHTGFIIKYKMKEESYLIAYVQSTTLIRGVPITYYFYQNYKNKSTIKHLLTKAKFYSAKLVYAN